jgi:putative oxidoreductase
MGGSLFLKHGMDKLFGYSQMVSHFPDPFHLGSQVTLTIALFSDAACSILVILGLAARWAALFIFANILVAWATIVHFQFFGHGVTLGEVLFLYLGSFLSIFLAGPGRYSFDKLLYDRLRRSRPS